MILTGETEVWSNGGMILTGETEVWSIGGMILTGDGLVLREKICHSSTCPVLYLKTQSVPRCKHTPPRLYKPVS